MAPKRDRSEAGGELPWEPITVTGPAGAARGRLLLPAGASAAALMVGGVGGGFDTPARDLYPRVAAALFAAGIGTLRVRFRDPRSLEPAVADVRAGMALLRARGAGRLALVGHSFGGAVVIRAAAGDGAVAGIVTLATQAYGTEPVRDLRVPLLLLHGDEDPVLSPAASRMVAAAAAGPTDVRILPGVGHDLLEAREQATAAVTAWLLTVLRGATDDRPAR